METRILNLMYKKIYQIVAKYNGKIIYEQSQSKRSIKMCGTGKKIKKSLQDISIFEGLSTYFHMKFWEDNYLFFNVRSII